MRFTERTDIAVKILIHLSLLKGAKISIDDLVERYIGHRSQVVAAVQELRKAGMIASSPGRRGGIWINRPPEKISLAEVIRMFETDFCLVKCFGDPSSCSIFHCCKFKEVLDVALDQFFTPLETTSIADLVKDLDEDMLQQPAQAC